MRGAPIYYALSEIPFWNRDVAARRTEDDNGVIA
jgi:hypothetical protein